MIEAARINEPHINFALCFRVLVNIRSANRELDLSQSAQSSQSRE